MARTLQLLNNSLAVITGAGSGIGRSVCKTLAANGAQIAAVDVNRESAHKTLELLEEGTHTAFCADVSNADSVKNLLADIQSKFQVSPSILVNSAGIIRDNLMLNMEESAFDEVIRVNLKGVFLMMQTTSELMIQNKIKNGSIINLSSIVGKVGNIGQINYSASKAGVIGMTKTAAKELARYNIRCNAVLPGFISTPMTDSVPAKIMEQMKAIIPMGRTGHPDEVAETILFLASQKSSYITGSTIEVTGGVFM